MKRNIIIFQRKAQLSGELLSKNVTIWVQYLCVKTETMQIFAIGFGCEWGGGGGFTQF